MKSHFILFCANPINPTEVDEDFSNEFLAAKELGFGSLLVNFEDLTNEARVSFATKRIRTADQVSQVIYRGWMLTPKQYDVLFNQLLAKNYQLINTAREYQNCHYLPDSLQFIESRTPRTIYQRIENEQNISDLIEKTKMFGNSPVIIKDYVKSEKHHWHTACFVENANDQLKLKSSLDKLMELRGKHLNEGIVVRAYVDLSDLTTHSKSGMPLKEEYRLFFCNHQLLGAYPYWEEGEYKTVQPDLNEWITLAKQVESNFFSMDIAKTKSGKWIVIELGDGQVAGIPDRVEKQLFYAALKKLLPM
ncbi:MAG: ATP-grasp domain-containing protein [Cyclobacteriaceae bacterium]|nr:ATP-grasp domain-containing protein [Cyclobacteriaceae bacterium]